MLKHRFFSNMQASHFLLWVKVKFSEDRGRLESGALAKDLEGTERGRLLEDNEELLRHAKAVTVADAKVPASLHRSD